jgi:hypothetical protein
MTYSQIKCAPRMLRKEDAEDYIGGRRMLQLMEQARPTPWITPAVARHKMTLYDKRLLDECCNRLTAGEFPTPAPTQAAAPGGSA